MDWHVTSIIFLLAVSATAHGQLTKPKDCGSELGCYSKCDGDSCSFVVTWKNQADHVDFTLSRDITRKTGNRYIALGLSSDDKMRDDSVTDCIMGSNVVTVAKSYNLDESDRGNIRIADQPSTGLSGMSGSSVGGVLTCSYSQTKTTDHAQVKPLTRTWTVFVADGKASNGFKSQHDELPSVSPQEVNFEKHEDITGEKKNVLVKVHGGLMIFAWIFCASIGIFMARFYKPVWPNSQVCTEKVWFAVHRLCMVLAFLFCAAGFVVIFVEVQEWSELDGHSNWQKAHPYLGVIVTFLAVVNPIMALIRPHPEDKNRHIFNWAHWMVGTGAHILAALTIILGLTLDKASTPFTAVWVVVGWLCYQIAVVLCMELFECILDDPGHRYYSYGALKEPRGSVVKKFVLGLHVLAITGLTAAVIILVAIN